MQHIKKFWWEYLFLKVIQHYEYLEVPILKTLHWETNPNALRMAKTPLSYGHSEYNRIMHGNREGIQEEVQSDKKSILMPTESENERWMLTLRNQADHQTVN